MGTPECYRSVCNRFGITESTGLHCVRKVTNALFRRAKMFIRWPSTMEAFQSMRAFYQQKSFPRVIGAIDGTYIHITKPARDSANYINRKGYYSIIMQGICDCRRRFIYCYAGEVGSVHDARVLRRSGLSEFYHNTFFPADSHLLGDRAYGINKYVLTPFKDFGNLDIQKKNYNYCLSSTRMKIEQAFGILKGRFRRIIDKLPMYRTDLIPRFVIALCVLHNIIIDEENLSTIIQQGMNNISNNIAVGNEERRHGIEKRFTIMRNLRRQLP